jgi:N-acetyl-anhydromuramyl-L-alanine amidase AmpD
MVRQFLGEEGLRQRPLWITAGSAAAVVLLGGIGLVGQRILRDRPVAMAPVSGPKAPAPPRQNAWTSPLERQCAAADPRLQQRLGRLRSELPRRLERVRIDPSNYGPRLARDAYGHPIPNQPQLVVLHETVYGINSAINTFTTHHPDDADQVSYHVLIGEKGRIVQLVDPDRRAFGAGYSAFRGRWAVTNRAMAGSVNNFALHLSLETPIDGENAATGHSGYTSAQYDAMAVVLAAWMQRYGIPYSNITTHRHVDLGLERADPRSFNWRALQVRLAALGVLC